jgi:hypothetical protein
MSVSSRGAKIEQEAECFSENNSEQLDVEFIDFKK